MIYGLIGIGVYLLLGLAIVVGVIAVFQNSLSRQRREPSGSLAPLEALANIAEEAHRHNPPEQTALPWIPPPAPVAVQADSPQKTPTPSLAEISERLKVLEFRVDQISGDHNENRARVLLQ